jgi:hypothetical protein
MWVEKHKSTAAPRAEHYAAWLAMQEQAEHDARTGLCLPGRSDPGGGAS